MFASLLAFLALASLTAAYQAPLYADPHGLEIEDQYIIVYKENVHFQSFQNDLEHAAQTYDVSHQYNTVTRGYAAKLNEEQLAAVRSNPNVAYVEMDREVHITSDDCTEPIKVESWGLSRIAQIKYEVDELYTYPESAGEGVTVYIVDTGIYIEHDDFAGRATWGWKAEKSWSETDKNGHGTHVSSTILGEKYGVARKAHAIAVKVLGDNGSGSMSGVVGGIDWVVSQYNANKKPTVINMSLGGSTSVILNQAVDAAFEAGIVVVVAAGNEDLDACDGSPSGASKVITVGATEKAKSPTSPDVRSYFSNWGPCVDVFAPGTAITAAWIGSPDATNTISGTSMASPHVAGVATLHLGAEPRATSQEIKDKIIAQATPDLIVLNCATNTCKKSPNLLLFNGFCDLPNVLLN